MASPRRAAAGDEDRSAGEEQERERRVLSQGTPSIARSIADAVVVKDGNLFLLTRPDGRVPLDGAHGYGLYHNDCRYLSGYALELDGVQPSALVSSAAAGFAAVHQLTNPDLRMPDGRLIVKEQIGIKWERTADGAHRALHERITFQNFGLEAVSFPVVLSFRAGFEDIYAVRELLAERPGELHDAEWRDHVLFFLYDGADGLHRSLTVHFSPGVDERGDRAARFQLELGPRASRDLHVSLVVAESEARARVMPAVRPGPGLDDIRQSLQRSSEKWVGHYTKVRTDGLLLNSVLRQSLLDLGVLRARIGDEQFIAAGTPWFATLFGRDSLVVANQILAFDRDIAAQTLRVLARHQGREVDEWREEQPGKILHELRIGELARLGRVPHTPYYGTVDATPLFLMLVARHAAWTGDLRLFDELRGNVERALEWMDRFGDRDGDGYLDYQRTSERGLDNQGWKDSGDAMVNADGSLAEPPIAPVEVQGYAYEARRLIAGLFRRAGEDGRAAALERAADELRRRFNRDYWSEALGTFVLARQAGGRPATVPSSNPGHALWCGIADEEKARRTMERLMAADMFSGWGVRTLSSEAHRYNPVGYHVGTVWPHDNSIIVAGLRRYGFDDAALRIFDGILQAARYFEHNRLPELFAGFGRDDYGVPVVYPVANHPQAWGAGSVPHMIQSLLGLTPEAFERRLRIVRPVLPPYVGQLEVRGLRVGDARVDLRFLRAAGELAVHVLRVEGDVDVVVEPAVGPG